MPETEVNVDAGLARGHVLNARASKADVMQNVSPARHLAVTLGANA